MHAVGTAKRGIQPSRHRQGSASNYDCHA